MLLFAEFVFESFPGGGAISVVRDGVSLGAVIAVVSSVAWFNWSGSGSRSVDVVPPVPPRLEQAAEQGRSQLPGRDNAGRGEPGALPLAALPPPGGVNATTPGSNTAAQAATVPAAPPPPVVAAPPPPPAPLIAGLPDGTRVALRAKATSADGSWVQVRDPRSGQVLLNRVLRPGESWPVPVRDGLLLDTGKADGLEIVVDNAFSPALEGLVGVRRNIALEPDRLRQRLVPATASATAAPIGAAAPNRTN